MPFTQTVKIIEEPGALGKLGEIMGKDAHKKAFLVCDPGINSIGLADKAVEVIASAGFSHVLYDKVQPDPSDEIIDNGANLCIEEKCDCVIALGGGSALDVGKGVNICRQNGGHILDFAAPDSRMRPSPGLISIPTTAGTGSELSNGLIVTDIKTGAKVPILAVNGMSEYAVIDSELTLGLPPSLTAITGLDVFSHACESYMSILACELTDITCEKIMADVVACLPEAVKDGSSPQARRRMLALASMGGWMLACASAHIGHSFAHVLGARHHIPHGVACAWSLPVVFDLLAPHMGKKIKYTGKLLGAQFGSRDTPVEIATKTTESYRSFCSSIGIRPPSFPLPAKVELEKISNDIACEPLAALSPIKFTAEEIFSRIAGLYDL